MRYLLLIADEPPSAPPADEARTTMREDYRACTDWLTDRGWLLAGEALRPAETATTVSIRGGQRIVTDGPFAETKEQVAGYYVIDCAGLDDAIEAAARIPGARTGRIEIRPIMELA